MQALYCEFHHCVSLWILPEIIVRPGEMPTVWPFVAQVATSACGAISEAALAKLCGVGLVPASSGKTNRHRLNRGGHRQANAALYLVVVVRLRTHQPTIDYVERWATDGKTKLEIIRCLKRFVAREIFGYLCRSPIAAPAGAQMAP
jgi:Transposase IS116/IS110/IS902 family